MKYETATYLIAFFGLASAAPMPVAAPKNVFSIPRAMLRGREVPQEHSHDRFLDGVRVNLALNNPANIEDPVFGLLGNAAAAAGAGSITNLDCLHQATADQAFTNAKAAGNVTGQADALMYAALERNTGSVGLASVLCNETAVNPEIQAISQHQDPASSGAAATNKAIVLALAQQLASIGADPQEALLSGTFAPGNPDDTTGKGNTCDTLNDPDGGCIFSQNLLVDDATAAEISAAVASMSVASVTTSAASTVETDATSTTDAACSVAFVTETASATASAAVAEVASSTSAAVATAGASTSTAAAGSLDFGSCSDPAILFENGLDGRTQPAFIAANQVDFNHGSALNIGVIASFICGQLSTSCKAPDATNTACTAAEAAASAAGGTTQAAADAFNSALGVSASTSTSSTASTASSSAVAVASASSTAAVAATSAAAAATPSASSTATTSSNVQTFTGDLGGLPPAVVESTGDRPFSVNGDTFVNKAAALQRSCSVQNNACADAVNSGQLAGKTVADCNTQEDACNAAASA